MENPEQTMDVPDDVMIECDSLVKIYKTKDIEVLALQGLDLTVKRGELMAIIGNSGSGKSTIVKILTGITTATKGCIYLEGKQISGKRTQKEIGKKVQMIFQNPKSSLNPKMTIGQNLDDALLYYRKIPKTERKRQCEEILERVHLPVSYLAKYPSQISGGECQRVCIARALLKKPKILILDDSTSAVDTHTDACIRQALRDEIPDTTKFIIAQRVTSLMDADQIIVLDEGRIDGIGTHVGAPEK